MQVKFHQKAHLNEAIISGLGTCMLRPQLPASSAEMPKRCIPPWSTVIASTTTSSRDLASNTSPCWCWSKLKLMFDGPAMDSTTSCICIPIPPPPHCWALMRKARTAVAPSLNSTVVPLPPVSVVGSSARFCHLPLFVTVCFATASCVGKNPRPNCPLHDSVFCQCRVRIVINR